jgi:Holliday junction DNA helicase RuvB subunit
MKSFIYFFALIIFFASCKKEVEGNWYTIEIRTARNIDCGIPEITFLSGADEAKQLTGSISNIYIAIGLPNVNYQAGAQLMVKIRKPEKSTDFIACATLGPGYSHVVITSMKDYRLDIMIDTGPNARSVQINLNPFTLIGATTRSGLLTAPLLSRFGIKSRLQYYDAVTLQKIILRSAAILNTKITSDAATEISGRSRGTPRIANGLLRRVRDFAQVLGNGVIDLGITEHSLKALNVDEHGLDEMDNKILSVIIEKFKGGPVGITTIATAVGEETGTLEEVYEPFLIQEGFLMRTPRGREVTPKAYEHLGKKPYGSAGVPLLFS